MLLILILSPLWAQEQVRGQVTLPDGQPAFAVKIFWLRAPEQAVLTDFSGSFELRLSAEPSDSLALILPGYEWIKLPLSAISSGEQLQVELHEPSLSLAEVAIEARRPIAEAFAVEEMDRMDVYLNPVSAGDPLRAIAGLAASTNTEESANPSLRGSSAVRTRVIYDGVPIYRPVRSSQLNGLGLFSLFNTEMLQSQLVFPSNPPLTYGNSSGGLVQIESSQEVSASAWQLSAGMANLGLFRTQKLGEKAFFQAYGNHQFSQLFIAGNRASLPFLQAFQTQDAGIKFFVPLSERWTLQSFSYGIRERAQVGIQTYAYQDTGRSKSLRSFHLMRVQRRGDQDVWSFHAGGDWGRSRFAYGNLRTRQGAEQQYAAVSYKRYANRQFTWQAGINYDGLRRSFSDTSSLYYFALSPSSPVEVIDTTMYRPLLEGHLFARWQPNQRWLLSGGLRSNLPLSGQAPFLSGQSSLRFSPNAKHSLLLGMGRYHSYIVPNFFLRGNELLRSDQLALDYTFQHSSTKITGALFAKRESGLQNDGFLFVERADIVGFEASWRQNIGQQLELQVAYTGLMHQIRFDLHEKAFPGSRDLPWFVKGALSWLPPRLGSFSLSYLGRSGTPFTPIIGGVFRDDLQQFEPVWSEDLNQLRTAAYHNLSLGYSRYLRFSQGSLVAFLNVNNVLNRLNPREPMYEADFGAFSWQPFSLRTWYAGLVWRWEAADGE